MTHSPSEHEPKRVDKSLLITGGNGGLGYETAKHLLLSDPGWHVVLTSRSRAAADSAVARLRQETGSESISGLTLDLASLEAIRDFVTRWPEQALPPLHALVLNAAVQATRPDSYTTDGFESNFGVNHLGNFLLVNLLLRHLHAPGRILFVGSGTHDPKVRLARATGVPSPRYRSAEQLAFPADHPDPGAPRNAAFLGRMRYATSKLCNVMTAYELSRRLARAGVKGITVNTFDPGLMPGTGLARDASAVGRFAWKRLLPALRLLVPNVKTPERSGENLARLVLEPSLADVTGSYVVSRAAHPSSAESYDTAKAEDLWEQSLKLVGLEPQDSLGGASV